MDVKLVQADGQTVSEIAREFEVTFKLRRELTTKAPALKVAIKAEREIFRLKRELQRLDIEDLEQAKVAPLCPRFAGVGRR